MQQMTSLERVRKFREKKRLERNQLNNGNPHEGLAELNDFQEFAQVFESRSIHLQELILSTLFGMVGNEQDYAIRYVVKHTQKDMYFGINGHIYSILESLAKTNETINIENVVFWIVAHPNPYYSFDTIMNIVRNHMIVGTMPKIIGLVSHLVELSVRSKVIAKFISITHKLTDTQNNIGSCIGDIYDFLKSSKISKSTTIFDTIIESQKIQIPEPVLGGIIPMLGKSIMFAPAKTGKTAFIMTIAEHFAQGKQFFFEHGGAKNSVLIVDFELTNVDYQLRFALNDHFFGTNIKLLRRPRDIGEIKLEIGIIKPDIIIIDNLSALVADLVDTKAIKELFDYFDYLEEFHTLILIAHTPKAAFGRILTIQDLFGATSQTNKATSVFSLNVNPKNSEQIYLKHHLTRRKSDTFVHDNNVLLLEKAVINGNFGVKPLKIVDERLLFEDEEQLLDSYKILNSCIEKRQSILSIRRTYGLTAKEFTNIMELGNLINQNKIQNDYTNYSNPYLDDAWDSLIHSSNEQIYA